jgi:prolyl-tRNA editing enzyme YbaK/EbsC (Cys-tRNA(Pro) deacylase)
MSTVTLDSILSRIVALERQRYKDIPDDVTVIDTSMKRARDAVESSCNCYSAVWKFVPEPYYTWTLQQRANCLGSLTGIGALCKSLLMENRKVVNLDNDDDITNPKFVLVVIQYAATLDVKKLTTCIRSLRMKVKERLDSNQFEWRIASEQDNATITGYEHNSVTPFGLLKPNSVPIILCSKINEQQHKFIYMGGGHGRLKLGLAVSEFCQALHPIIADISQPRSAFDLEQGGLD